MTYKTEQEEFWAGDFGNNYIDRNSTIKNLSSDIHLFSDILGKMEKFSSLMEFGANIGMNLRALKTLMPNLFCAAVEINAKARVELQRYADQVFGQSILDYIPEQQYDAVLCKGILIHLNPAYLNEVYQKMYDVSRKYIIIAEYYNPTPVMVNYKGNADRLFKRDFPGELMDMFPDLRLREYGFQYHRDINFPMDDINWFLLEK